MQSLTTIKNSNIHNRKQLSCSNTNAPISRTTNSENGQSQNHLIDTPLNQSQLNISQHPNQTVFARQRGNIEPPKLSKEAASELKNIFDKIEEKHHHYLGYPNNLNFDYSELAPFLNLAINNCGDPWQKANFQVDTKAQEIEVIQHYGELFSLSPDSTWGYVTNGSSEGNMMGMLLGREKFPTGIVYYSADAHYSIPKNAWLLGIPSEKIDSLPHGEVDCKKLIEKIKESGKPAILMPTIGTTMKGASDNIREISKELQKAGLDFYLHCDAALSGGFVPYIDKHVINFKELPIDSVSLSGHKFIGSPIPCGIFITRQENMKTMKDRQVEYVGAADTTITGSRNGFTPLVLWTKMKMQSSEQIQSDAEKCIELAKYTTQSLNKLGWGNGHVAYRNPNSTTIVFKKPSQEICRYWQLATVNDEAHLIILPHTDKALIDRFLTDIHNEMNKKNI